MSQYYNTYHIKQLFKGLSRLRVLERRDHALLNHIFFCPDKVLYTLQVTINFLESDVLKNYLISIYYIFCVCGI